MKKLARISSISILILFILACKTLTPGDGGQPSGAATSPVEEVTEQATEAATSQTEEVTEQPTEAAPAATGKEALVGNWKETWGVGQVTDVTYNDIYTISLRADGELTMSCDGRPTYSFGDVLFEGNVLSVTLDNNGFIIDYVMTLSADGNSFTGKATTPKDTFNILWERIQ
jgi:hypothetical protein